MKQTAKKNRFLTLMGDLCNGEISQRDGAWLEELLLTDPEAQGIYVDYMAMHASLYSECATLELPIANGSSREQACATDAMVQDDRFLGLTSSFEVDDNPRLVSPRLSTAAAPRHTSWSVAVALVGIALFSSLFSYFAFPRLFPGAAQLADGSVAAPADGLVVARITGTQNCLWNNSGSSVGYGSKLVAGQRLELLEGLAKITFQDGATVLLESPASFVVDAPHEVALHTGRMAAVVPRESRGFRVHTRTLDIFHVGTEFGLLARESGAAEVHVFNGLMKADVLDAAGNPHSRLELNASEAARVNPVSTTIVEFPANEAAFVRSMIPSSGPQDGLLAYEGFEYPDGPLASQNGGFGWAGPWFDIEADSDAGPDSNCVGSGSLAVEGIVPLGNRAVQTAQRNRIRRSLGTSVGGVFDVARLVENQDGVRLVGRDGNQVYLSFLQRVSTIDDGFYGLELHRGDGNSNRVLCVGNGAEGTGYGATSNVNAYGLKNFPSLGQETSEANFYVIKITFGVNNRDIVEIYRNPESLRVESACEVDAVLKGNFTFDRISIGNFDGSKVHELDEVRVGTHFLAVTGRWGGERGGRLIHRITSQNPRTIRIATLSSAYLPQGWLLARPLPVSVHRL